MDLTESFAMTPAASVSGLYFAHPQCEVLRDPAHRPRSGRGLRAAKGADVAEVERALRSILAYEPALAAAAR